MINNNKL